MSVSSVTSQQIQTQLSGWAELDRSTATLVNLSENHTFRLNLPNGEQRILRVHRPGYHGENAIQSELAWLHGLRTETELPTVTPIPGLNGELVQSINAVADGPSSFAVLFRFEKGKEARADDDLHGIFSELGRFAAICHSHAEIWRYPTGFSRPKWDADGILNANGLWGDWRRAPHVGRHERVVLERAEIKLRAVLNTYGENRSRFGLIHADMRLANILMHEGAARLIDFDDCGFGWYAYDFAAAVSFFEDSPQIPALKHAWLEAYRSRRAFSLKDEQAIDAMILLRRFALLAWIGTHCETQLAQQHVDNFALGTIALAQNFLSL